MLQRPNDLMAMTFLIVLMMTMIMMGFQIMSIMMMTMTGFQTIKKMKTAIISLISLTTPTIMMEFLISGLKLRKI